jgi:hypothetical protein
MRALGRGGAVLAAGPTIRVAAVRCTSGGRLARRVGAAGLASTTSTLLVEAQPRSVRPQAATHRITTHSNRRLSACVRRDGSAPNCILLGDRCPMRMSSGPGRNAEHSLSRAAHHPCRIPKAAGTGQRRRARSHRPRSAGPRGCLQASSAGKRAYDNRSCAGLQPHVGNRLDGADCRAARGLGCRRGWVAQTALGEHAHTVAVAVQAVGGAAVVWGP